MRAEPFRAESFPVERNLQTEPDWSAELPDIAMLPDMFAYPDMTVLPYFAAIQTKHPDEKHQIAEQLSRRLPVQPKEQQMTALTYFELPCSALSDSNQPDKQNPMKQNLKKQTPDRIQDRQARNQPHMHRIPEREHSRKTVFQRDFPSRPVVQKSARLRRKCFHYSFQYCLQSCNLLHRIEIRYAC